MSTHAICLISILAYGIAKNMHNLKEHKMKMFTGLFIKRKSNCKHGKWKEFNKQAILIAEGHYIDGRKHGLWKQYYDDDGALMIEEVYENGIPHGRYSTYHVNGCLLSEGTYVNGRREGYFKIYDEVGKHIRSMQFLNNDLIEEHKIETF